MFKNKSITIKFCWRAAQVYMQGMGTTAFRMRRGTGFWSDWVPAPWSGFTFLTQEEWQGCSWLVIHQALLVSHLFWFCTILSGVRHWNKDKQLTQVGVKAAVLPWTFFLFSVQASRISSARLYLRTWHILMYSDFTLFFHSAEIGRRSVPFCRKPKQMTVKF